MNKQGAMDEKASAMLHSQLIKLGDMMGDGLHLEPDGRWIAKEYLQIAKKLGYAPLRSSSVQAINESMALALEKTRCPSCSGVLQQTRSGSRRAKCLVCEKRYQFKNSKR